MRERYLLVLVCAALAACGRGDTSGPGPLPEDSIRCGSEALFAAAHHSCEPMQAEGDEKGGEEQSSEPMQGKNELREFFK